MVYPNGRGKSAWLSLFNCRSPNSVEALPTQCRKTYPRCGYIIACQISRDIFNPTHCAVLAAAHSRLAGKRDDQVCRPQRAVPGSKRLALVCLSVLCRPIRS